jgi:hypothetical protein
LAIKVAETYIKKVNRMAFHILVFLKYLKVTATRKKEANGIFHFGEIINNPANTQRSNRKLILMSDDVSLDIIFFIIMVYVFLIMLS